MAGEPLRPAFQVRVLTLFPQMIEEAASHSILGRGIAAGAVALEAQDIRDQTTDRHRTADDVPYGGGPGMVMKPEPLVRSIQVARAACPGAPVLLMSASGRLFSQAMARSLAEGPGLILVCGHYEGVDERVAAHYCDGEVCIGDYVLSGGEPAALVVVDAVSRLVPGVLGNRASLSEESHERGLLEYPQYTRPPEFEGHAVPDVLLSGNHAEIARWRKQEALAKTRRMRPDLAAALPPEPTVERRRSEPAPFRLGRPPS